VAAWPVAAWAHKARVSTASAFSGTSQNDPVGTGLIRAFRAELQRSGWIAGQNIRIETRWAGFKTDDIRRHAAELVALTPDVILANGTSTLGPLLQASRTIPIVFVQVTDPVGSGYVASLARPGGYTTGFQSSERPR
jgi:putative ABC transport system substrate-binding protein